jgi:hypothetical protein
MVKLSEWIGPMKYHGLARSILLMACLFLGFGLGRAEGQTFQTSVVATGNPRFVGQYCSVAEVAGHPAVSYYDDTADDLKFARATSPDGSGNWIITTVDSAGSVGFDTSLAIVDGRPAISYTSLGLLRFAINSAADGSGNWTTQSVAFYSSSAIDYGTSLAVVDGRPAISFLNGSTGDLMFVMAATANGTGNWTTQTVDATNYTGLYSSLAVVDGRPAISYHDSTAGDLKFAINSAADATGNWTLTTVDSTNFTGCYSSLAVIDGKPAIGYLDPSFNRVRFAINSAADATGNWTTSTVDTSTFRFVSLRAIDGLPALAYHRNDNALAFARNSAANGSGNWTIQIPPFALGFLSPGEYASLAVIDGRPGIAHHSSGSGDVRFTHNSAADGSGNWTTVIVENTGVVGRYTSQAIVDGNPAILFYDEVTEDLAFARNSAADGLGNWTRTTIDSAGLVGQHGSLAVIDGNPSAAYYDVANGDLKFARSSTANGSGNWTTATVDTAGDVGQFASLAVVDGKPAISYYNATNADLKFAINSAADASGNWTISNAHTAGSVGQYSALAVVDGTPAASCYNATFGTLLYVRNSAPDGSGNWTAITVDGSASGPFVGQFTSLCVVDGRPAISYFSSSNISLQFARSTTANGTGNWTVTAVDGPGLNAVGRHTSLRIIEGKPMIAYVDSTASDPKIARNSQPDGSGVWTVLPIDGSFSVNAGEFASLAALADGKPAVSYYDSTNGQLVWARLKTVGAVPEIALYEPVATERTNGSVVASGPVPLGSNLVKTIAIKNLGAANLTLSLPVLSGNHTADFPLNTAGTVLVLPYLEGTTFNVTFTPTTSGNRSASVVITNNDSNEGNSTLSLTGRGLSFAEDVDGDGLNDAAEWQLQSLGFNFLSAQSALVQTLFANAEGAGLFTPAQVQALHVGTPLIQRAPDTGIFTLTLELQKSATLAPASFSLFPFTNPETTITPEGRIEFEFTSPEDAAFYRIHAD